MEAAEQSLKHVEDLLSQGQTDKAGEAFRSLPAAQYQDQESLRRFGLLALRLNYLVAACQIFSRANQFFPSEPTFLHNLGTAHMLLGELKEASLWFQKAIEQKDDYSIARFNLGMCCERQGLFNEAKRIYEELVRKDSGHFAAYVRLALLAERMGDLDELRRQAEACIRLDPDHEQTFYVRAFLSKREKQFTDALKLIDLAIQIASESHQYLFLKAQIQEELEAYSAVIQTLKEANAFDPNVIQKVRHKALSDHHLMTKLFAQLSKNPVSKSKVGPIFILCPPRSGSTLLAEMLGSHSEIVNAGELDTFERLYYRVTQMLGCGDSMSVLIDLLYIKKDPRVIYSIQQEYQKLILDVGVRDESLFYVDKGISNSFFLPLIALCEPGARYIQLKRNPYEVAFSTYKNGFDQFFWFKHDPRFGLENYEMVHNDIHNAAKALQLHLLPVNYEDLVVKPEQILEEICSFVGVEFENQMLEYHQNNSHVATASYAQVRRKLYRESLNKFQNNYPEVYSALRKFKEL